MEAICYDTFVDQFKSQLQSGTIYVFKRIVFQPADLPLPFRIAIPSDYIIILRAQTEIQLAGPLTYIPGLPQRFNDFTTVYHLRNNMLAGNLNEYTLLFI